MRVPSGGSATAANRVTYTRYREGMNLIKCHACGNLHPGHHLCTPNSGPLGIRVDQLEQRVADLEQRGTPTAVIRVVEAPPTAPDAGAEREATLRYLTWFAGEYDIAVLHRAIAHIKEGRHTPRTV